MTNTPASEQEWPKDLLAWLRNRCDSWNDGIPNAYCFKERDGACPCQQIANELTALRPPAGVDTVGHTDVPQQVTGFVEVSDYVKKLETDAEARGYARAKAGDAVTADPEEVAIEFETEIAEVRARIPRGTTWEDEAHTIAQALLAQFSVTRKAAG